MTTKVFTFACCLFGLAALINGAAFGAGAIVIVGDHQLEPNTAGQEILIYVDGDDAVQGLNFQIQIDDGVLPPGQTAPKITAVDITTDTIFGNSNNGSHGNLSESMVWARWTTTDEELSTATVTADGLLATVTIDTTGISGGVFDLTLDTLDGKTDWGGSPGVEPPELRDGSITVGE